MKIDLLGTETQRLARRTAIGRLETLQRHAQNVAIEGDGGVRVRRRHHDMIN